MSAATDYRHIAIDDASGPRIEGTRYKVAHLAAEHYAYGWTAEELMRQHPDLRPEQVYAALLYFYDHFDAMTVAIKADGQAAEGMRELGTLSRSDLLARER